MCCHMNAKKVCVLARRIDVTSRMARNSRNMQGQIVMQFYRILYLCTLWQYICEYFLKWEKFQTKVVEKIKTRILCSVTFFEKKSRFLSDNVEKCRAR